MSGSIPILFLKSPPSSPRVHTSAEVSSTASPSLRIHYIAPLATKQDLVGVARLRRLLRRREGADLGERYAGLVATSARAVETLGSCFEDVWNQEGKSESDGEETSSEKQDGGEGRRGGPKRSKARRRKEARREVSKERYGAKIATPQTAPANDPNDIHQSYRFLKHHSTFDSSDSSSTAESDGSSEILRANWKALRIPFYAVGSATARSWEIIVQNWLPGCWIEGENSGTAEALAAMIVNRTTGRKGEMTTSRHGAEDDFDADGFHIRTGHHDLGDLTSSAPPPPLKLPLLFLAGDPHRPTLARTLSAAKIPITTRIVYRTQPRLEWIDEARDYFKSLSAVSPIPSVPVTSIPSEDTASDACTLWIAVFSPAAVPGLLEALGWLDGGEIQRSENDIESGNSSARDTNITASIKTNSALKILPFKSFNDTEIEADVPFHRRRERRAQGLPSWRIRLACVGPTTAASLAEARSGVQADVCAEIPGEDGVVEAIRRMLERSA